MSGIGEIEQWRYDTNTVAFLLIKTELPDTDLVAQQIAAKPGVLWAIVANGPYDIIAAVEVGNNAELGDLVFAQVRKVPGLKNPSAVVGSKGYGRRPFP